MTATAILAPSTSDLLAAAALRRRPSFESLDAFRAYTVRGFSDFPGCSSIRYDISLCCCAMTVDAFRDGRVVIVHY